VERISVEVIYHDQSKVIYERGSSGDWFYTEKVPDEKQNKSPLLSKYEEVVSGSSITHALELLIKLLDIDPMGRKSL